MSFRLVGANANFGCASHVDSGATYFHSAKRGQKPVSLSKAIIAVTIQVFNLPRNISFASKKMVMDHLVYAIPAIWPLHRFFGIRSSLVNPATYQQREPSHPYSPAPSSHGTFIFSGAAGGRRSCQRSVRINQMSHSSIIREEVGPFKRAAALAFW